MTPKPENGEWFEKGDVAIYVEDTAVGREISLFERYQDEWRRKYTLPAGQAREYRDLLNELFPE